MKLEEIAIGDVVKLNSGGPDMTVQGICERRIDCQWIDHCNITGKLVIDVACLTLVSKAP